MNDALYIAATGMKAQSSQLDAIANNVANVNTPGFKRSSLRFGDLVVAGLASANATDESAAPRLSALAGVAIQSMQRSQTAGELRRVDDPMSLAILGEGYIELLMPDGSSAYTRGTRLQANTDRLLATADGHVLRQQFHLPADVRGVNFAEDGTIVARDEAGREWTLGRIDLTTFANPAELAPAGEGLLRATRNAGEPTVAPAGEAGTGRIKQGFQEASNVALVDEMVQLMVAQRAYEMSVKVVQAADELAGLTNNLRK